MIDIIECVWDSVFLNMNWTNHVSICIDFITMILEEHTFQDPESDELSPEISAVIQQAHEVRPIPINSI